MNDELRELITLEDYLNRLLRRVQRRVIASGGKIEDGGDICGLSKAEALAEIEEEAAQSEGPTAGDLNEIITANIRGKEEAAKTSPWLTEERRNFLIRRFAYWD